MRNGRAVVLGAGLQGVCSALALTGGGYAVTLIDEAPACLLRASLVNEGKIHLGHVYANDPTFETPRLMLRAALSFAPIVERLLGHAVPWAQLISMPFVYLVARDSLLTVDELLAHYARLDDEYHVLCGEHPGGYVGTAPETLWQQISIPSTIDPEFIAAAVATPEVSLDTSAFRVLLSQAAQCSPHVEPLFGHVVDGVVRTASGFRIEGHTADGDWNRTADLVVNCLWSGRLRIDEQMGALPRRRWVHRLKYRVMADLPDHLTSAVPSVTIALGRYGDIVTHQGNRSAYLSWYPACLRGWVTSVDIPDEWQGPISGQVDAATAADVVHQTLEAFDAIVPGLGRSTVTDVRAGVIFSWGHTDIDDPMSELHERRKIGVEGHDGYFSINTGKFTCAPLFADELLGALD